jgi:hypothetical protein
MIHTLSKGLNQKPAMIKGLPPVAPSRAFALWLALLFLYFLLLPSAAETPERGAEISASVNQKGRQTVSVPPAIATTLPPPQQPSADSDPSSGKGGDLPFRQGNPLVVESCDLSWRPA